MTSKRISLDKGLTFLTAEEAAPIIWDRNLMGQVLEIMDPGTRHQVYAEQDCVYFPVFLARYLELAPSDLIMGIYDIDALVFALEQDKDILVHPIADAYLMACQTAERYDDLAACGAEVASAIRNGICDVNLANDWLHYYWDVHASNQPNRLPFPNPHPQPKRPTESL